MWKHFLLFPGLSLRHWGTRGPQRLQCSEMPPADLLQLGSQSKACPSGTEVQSKMLVASNAEFQKGEFPNVGVSKVHALMQARERIFSCNTVLWR